MGVSEILKSIDQEISILKQARALLAGSEVTAVRKAGRPRKQADAAAVAPQAGKTTAKRKKRKLTPEGRKRIADAVKRRWEAHRKATGGTK